MTALTQIPLAERDRPTPDEVAEVKRRFPTDPAAASAIDLRYGRRDRPGWTPTGLHDLTRSLNKFLGTRVSGPFTVRDARWLTGGASKIQMGFTLDWTHPGRGEVSDRLLVRMDPPESLNTTNKQTEFEIVQAVTGALPAPEALWVDPRGTEFPEPALVYAFSTGAALPSDTEGAVSGIGTGFGPELRARLAPQFVAHLAAMHTIDPSGLESPAVSIPRVGTTDTARWRLNFERTIWELDRGQDVPLMELAAGWMQHHLPVADRVGIVHGDFRSGNFLFDEETAQITAWLDWELAHIGDRHEDLAYCTHPLFGAMAEDGTTFLASGVLPRDEVFAQYEQASGLSVDPARIEWYSMLATFSAILRTSATPYRVARLGRSHQDILLTRLEGVVPLLMIQLVGHLEKVM